MYYKTRTHLHSVMLRVPKTIKAEPPFTCQAQDPMLNELQAENPQGGWCTWGTER